MMHRQHPLSRRCSKGSCPAALLLLVLAAACMLPVARCAAGDLTLTATPAKATGSAGKSVRVKINTCINGCGQRPGDAAPVAANGACAQGCYPMSVGVALTANSTGSLATTVPCNPAARISGSLSSLACHAGSQRKLTGRVLVVPIGEGGVGEFTVWSNTTGMSALTISATRASGAAGSSPQAAAGGGDKAAAAAGTRTADVVVMWDEPGPAKVALQAAQADLHWGQVATVTALVLDTGRAPVKGSPVIFSVVGACKPAPVLSQEMVVTDEWGRASTSVRSSMPCEAAVIATARSKGASVMGTKAVSSAIASAPAHLAFMDDETVEEQLEAQQQQQQRQPQWGGASPFREEEEERRAPPPSFEGEREMAVRTMRRPGWSPRDGPRRAAELQMHDQRQRREELQMRSAPLREQRREEGMLLRNPMGGDPEPEEDGIDERAAAYLRRFASRMADMHDAGGGGLSLQSMQAKAELLSDVVPEPAGGSSGSKSGAVQQDDAAETESPLLDATLPPKASGGKKSKPRAAADKKKQAKAQDTEDLDAELDKVLQGFGFKG